ncbi:MAG: bifunctional phosphoribosylaminoimidazolecarboxamide formyltransferase/IMP cyclohydrolase [Candidatus Altiarchaeales archaeon ex4484_2]|nr:MAG: bifunctional phosphoribosylaminoimidazolecarboxamide formyltransferase/IMP cyclohydrolase [Candidatus Altiarchaeales archaeon ex4484_2]
MRVKRALISVSDKRGIVGFASRLQELGVEIISTGGTARVLREGGIQVTGVSEETGFPELFDGRVKTLHPRIHGGLLNVRANREHQMQMKDNGIKPIDLLVCNLYPFQQTILREGHSINEAIENIDVGGPAMVRAAAKNYRDVVVVMDPDDYDEIIDDLRTCGDILKERRRKLASHAFRVVSNYDWSIHEYLVGDKEKFPMLLDYRFEKKSEMRYGENPHQRAFFYHRLNPGNPSIANARQLHGARLSLNNMLDLDSALQIIKEYEKPSVVIIKHTNPCGMASCGSLAEAYRQALDCDSLSAFGGVVGLNQEVDEETAGEMSKIFLECVLAPSYSAKALEILGNKKRIRLMEVPGLGGDYVESLSFRQVSGGLLLQETDSQPAEPVKVDVVSRRKPTDEELASLFYAWKLSRYVKSNAAVLAKGERTVGIGSGHTSRVDAVRTAVHKAGDKALGASLASEAFIPFRDNIDEAKKAGITAVIEPGGSIRDNEVIEAADEHDIALVFTGIRCFRH